MGELKSVADWMSHLACRMESAFESCTEAERVTKEIMTVEWIDLSGDTATQIRQLCKRFSNLQLRADRMVKEKINEDREEDNGTSHK